MTKYCPKCSGKMYVEVINSDEACCINCGYIEYQNEIAKENPLRISEGRPHRKRLKNEDAARNQNELVSLTLSQILSNIRFRVNWFK